MVSRYGGTRLGRQELDGELPTDTPGALWTRDMIDELRQSEAPPLRRIVVAVDPAMSNNEGSDETGIIVAGVGRQRDNEGHEHGYILADLTGKYSPNEWAQIVVEAYDEFKADRVIAEVNNGGELVRHTVQTQRASLPFKPVIASRGKVARAEPVSALYEQKRVHHCGTDLVKLEDQMSEFTSDFDRRRMGYSPDRVDARGMGDFGTNVGRQSTDGDQSRAIASSRAAWRFRPTPWSPRRRSQLGAKQSIFLHKGALNDRDARRDRQCRGHGWVRPTYLHERRCCSATQRVPDVCHGRSEPSGPTQSVFNTYLSQRERLSGAGWLR